MNVWRAFTVLPALAATCVVSAGAAGPGSGVREGGTFRIAFPANRVESIDPFLDNFPAMQFVFDATCASLLRRRDEPLPAGRTLVPELATGFPRVSNGGRTYTFIVRKGFRFSTGAPVTARDVAASVRRALRLKGSYRASDFMNVVGARAFADGRAVRLRGLRVRGNRVSFRLAMPQPDFASAAGTLCVLPAGLPLDPEGVRAPVPSAGPYTLTSYLPGRRIAVVRNRFYRGSRPHHVDRFEVTLVDDQAGLVEAVERGTYDWVWVLASAFDPHAPRLVDRFGVNRQRFFVRPGVGVCMFVLNGSQPLFRNNPKLRRAVSFAVNRRKLVRELGPHRAVPTDQYLLPHHRAFRDAHLYPSRPDLKKAKKLARGNTRSGKAIFYTRDDTLGLSHGAIVRADLARIGLDVQVKPFPTNVLFAELLPKRGEPFDIGWICFLNIAPDALSLNGWFDGRTLNQPEHFNFSHFDSAKVNRRLDKVSRLIGPAFNRAYGELDIELAREYAPAVTYAYTNELTFVSARTGCVVTNPSLDLAAVCLK
jgi:peptide/nickel transport system substrate-binding protein